MSQRFALSASVQRPLLERTTCPSCWHDFDPADVLFIAVHEDLRGDVRLGPDEMSRFRPTRFSRKGHALDARGEPCPDLACPNCHLPLPHALLESPPVFFSILGTPGCGKSFYIAALCWELRQLLPKRFALSFADADLQVNRYINDHETRLFLGTSSRPVPLNGLIAKTDVGGNDALLYASVMFGSRAVTYPRPAVFVMRPLPTHPSKHPEVLHRVLCLYDNPGEHFLPGSDNANRPTTRHLARSQVLLYLFDPTQDPRFARLFHSSTGQELPTQPTMRQELVLREAISRIRKFGQPGEKLERCLIVVVTKYDVWKPLFRQGAGDPYLAGDGVAGLDMESIKDRSEILRAILTQTCPDVVTAAEDFTPNVLYWPVSPLGEPPTTDARGVPVVVPANIRPIGVTAPVLFGLHRTIPKLIPAASRVSKVAK